MDYSKIICFCKYFLNDALSIDISTITRLTEMKILIHGLVYKVVERKVEEGSPRACSNRMAYKMIISKNQLGHSWASVTIS